ncbi:MAG: hypothetical protein RLZ10_1795, partial [Bacteroidota bacterium]
MPSPKREIIMIKLKHLLLENPDTVLMNGSDFYYKGNINRSAFFVEKNTLFGFSANKKEFYALGSDAKDILEGLDLIEGQYDKNTQARSTQNYIVRVITAGNGGSHTDLEVVYGTALNFKRTGVIRYDYLSDHIRGRIF